MAGRQPVVEGFAGGRRIGARRIVGQARLIQGVLGILAGLLRLFDGAPCLPGRRFVDEVFKREVVLDPGQVLDHIAPQPDQKAGEHESDDPQTETEPFFRQPQCFAHARAPFSLPATRPMPLTTSSASAPPTTPTTISSNNETTPPNRPLSAARCAMP